jgi:hypothetical protein
VQLNYCSDGARSGKLRDLGTTNRAGAVLLDAVAAQMFDG